MINCFDHIPSTEMGGDGTKMLPKCSCGDGRGKVLESSSDVPLLRS